MFNVNFYLYFNRGADRPGSTAASMETINIYLYFRVYQRVNSFSIIIKGEICQTANA